ncbi:thiol-disulfide oxidoreductase DCC family protein [Phenylobacterium sp.]|uniref:thiol-disulfide oxidoreductase DCC family protein n=1 Tax=Phenylobacterium sp. TaxID=1871053 RepID=UPI0027375F42|nr:thiol-disulfide oxidoreductase DCC family protein [Phenylobacterium sp.]MDP3854163.1 thiol-disulfide oxidoreductase DCC family protein [Phenylobacterium sp.]
MIDPAPADPSPDGLWVFDGVCNFCSGSVRLALALDRDKTLRFTPMQSPYGRLLAAKAGLDPDAPNTFVFFDRGRALGASDAVMALAARLPAPWRWATVLRFVPRPLRDATHGWIARNRYRLMGRRESCMVPTPEIRARFILEPPIP